jgi:hypothetical protein
MGLVDYSDSDASDSEETTVTKSTTTSSKPAFQKVVDRSNPGKIRVSLPQAASKEEPKSDEPAAKRVKTGGGSFGGFNSFLPAPKRTGPVISSGGLGNAAAPKRGLGAGVSLKTGAAPDFSREPEPIRDDNTEDSTEAHEETVTPNSGLGMSLPPPRASTLVSKPAEEIKLVGKPTMFRPLSVARKPTKKTKKTTTATTPATNPEISAKPEEPVDKPKPRAKISLFSMGPESSSQNTTPTISTGEYQPLVYEPVTTHSTEYNHDPSPVAAAPSYTGAEPGAQSLNDIASDLNLSAAERRQLFGRQKGGAHSQAAMKIINFNTDQEYSHNEELRASGEQIQHNPVRSIAPGKHSLKQLVNAASSQKEALEESFAKGKSNRAEASSRYGW